MQKGLKEREGEKVCVLEGEGNRVFAGKALVVVSIDSSVSGYSDCLTGFCEPLSPPCRCHAGLKKCLAQSL